MKPRVVIVHGIHTNEDEEWMRTVETRFLERGWRTYVWTYGYARAIFTRWQNPGRAKKLAELIQPDDVLLTHSNGGCLAWMAGELGAPFSGWISLMPALDTNKLAAKHVKWVNLYTNRYDNAVPLAAWFGLRDLAPHPWGAQGRDGISVPDVPRYRVVETSIPRNDAPAVKGHSAVLQRGPLRQWADVFVNHAEARL